MINRDPGGLILLLTVLSTGAFGQPGASGTPKARESPVVGTGAAYTLWVLHHSDYDEMQAGQLAMANAGSEELKAFGRTLVTDHQAASQKVLATARKLQVDLEPNITGGDKALFERMKAKMGELKSIKGAQFDASFSKMMTREYQRVIAIVTEALDDPKQESIKPLLQDLLPQLKSHERVAQNFK